MQPAVAVEARGDQGLMNEKIRVVVEGAEFADYFWPAAEQMVDAVKKVLHEGNVRRIVIKQEGRTVAEFPLTVGVVGAVVAPILAAVGALAAVLTECSIEVERTKPESEI